MLFLHFERCCMSLMQSTQKIFYSLVSSVRVQLYGIAHFKSPPGYLNLALMAVNSNW